MSADRAAIVIPARYASQRLPGKPLLAETGKPLIQHTYESVSAVAPTIVATDDERIFSAVLAFGGRATMTSGAHRSGTDRVAEVARDLEAKILVNVQGDEPDLNPRDVDSLIRLLERDPEADMATLAYPSRDRARWADPNTVKLVRDGRGGALYFSRAGIPYDRERGGMPESFLIHLGVYAYRRAVLLDLADRPPVANEEIEKLEQLRALDAGYRLLVGLASALPSGIDTPEDYRRFCERARNWESP